MGQRDAGRDPVGRGDLVLKFAFLSVLLLGCTATAEEAPTKLTVNCEYYSPQSVTGVMVGLTQCETDRFICLARGDAMSCIRKEPGE